MDRTRVEVREVKRNGISVAYAVQWDKYFGDWQCVSTGDDTERFFLGTCVEGVRVTFSTPGYQNNTIIAMANATGKNAPRTNVARSGIERTVEGSALTRTVYEVYCDHVKEEVRNLYAERRHSVGWAAGEASYLIGPLEGRTVYGRRIELTDSEAFHDAVSGIARTIIEKDGVREPISVAALKE